MYMYMCTPLNTKSSSIFRKPLTIIYMYDEICRHFYHVITCFTHPTLIIGSMSCFINKGPFGITLQKTHSKARVITTGVHVLYTLRACHSTLRIPCWNRRWESEVEAVSINISMPLCASFKLSWCARAGSSEMAVWF